MLANKTKGRMVYQTTASLESVVRAINETLEILNSPNRVAREKVIPAEIGGAIGMAMGVPVSYAGLYGLGKVGFSGPGITSALAKAGKLIRSGMKGGVFVLIALPALTIGAGGYSIGCYMNRKQVQQERQRLYDVIQKTRKIVNTALTNSDVNGDKAGQLACQEIILASIAANLQHDLMMA